MATDSDIKLTPPYIVSALGPFDLDPCFGHPRPWVTAERMYALEDGEDGLSLPWEGRVWLNPPYSDLSRWLERMASHGNGIAMTFARTDTRAFHNYVFPRASGVLFLQGRFYFHAPDGGYAKGTKLEKKGKKFIGPRNLKAVAMNSNAPSVLISYDTSPSKPNFKSLRDVLDSSIGPVGSNPRIRGKLVSLLSSL